MAVKPQIQLARDFLDEFRVMHEIHNGGEHLVVRAPPHTIDLWPSKQKFRKRGATASGQGLVDLAKVIGLPVAEAREWLKSRGA